MRRTTRAQRIRTRPSQPSAPHAAGRHARRCGHTYPEWRAKGATLTPPTAQYAYKPEHNDASTRIADRADTEPVRQPAYDRADTLHLSGNIYLIAGAGGNITVSVGGDGVLMVDFGSNRRQRTRHGGCSRGGTNPEAVGRT